MLKKMFEKMYRGSRRSKGNKYEFPLKLKGYGIVYPDFTLLDVKHRREIYWEHFGMMDNPEYAYKAVLKLETYMKNGFYPGKNLLLTFETY